MRKSSAAAAEPSAALLPACTLDVVPLPAPRYPCPLPQPGKSCVYFTSRKLQVASCKQPEASCVLRAKSFTYDSVGLCPVRLATTCKLRDWHVKYAKSLPLHGAGKWAARSRAEALRRRRAVALSDLSKNARANRCWRHALNATLGTHARVVLQVRKSHGALSPLLTRSHSLPALCFCLAMRRNLICQ